MEKIKSQSSLLLGANRLDGNHILLNEWAPTSAYSAPPNQLPKGKRELEKVMNNLTEEEEKGSKKENEAIDAFVF